MEKTNQRLKAIESLTFRDSLKAESSRFYCGPIAYFTRPYRARRAVHRHSLRRDVSDGARQAPIGDPIDPAEVGQLLGLCMLRQELWR